MSLVCLCPFLTLLPPSSSPFPSLPPPLYPPSSVVRLKHMRAPWLPVTHQSPVLSSPHKKSARPPLQSPTHGLPVTLTPHPPTSVPPRCGPQAQAGAPGHPHRAGPASCWRESNGCADQRRERALTSAHGGDVTAGEVQMIE